MNGTHQRNVGSLYLERKGQILDNNRSLVPESQVRVQALLDLKLSWQQTGTLMPPLAVSCRHPLALPSVPASYCCRCCPSFSRRMASRCAGTDHRSGWHPHGWDTATRALVKGRHERYLLRIASKGFVPKEHVVLLQDREPMAQSAASECGNISSAHGAQMGCLQSSPSKFASDPIQIW